MKKISADYIFPIDQSPLKEGVVVIDDNGKILELSKRDVHDPASVEIHKGIIIPGFINTH